eukprot:13046480-Alexandrium_andersonii.AAC.1
MLAGTGVAHAQQRLARWPSDRAARCGPWTSSSARSGSQQALRAYTERSLAWRASGPGRSGC